MLVDPIVQIKVSKSALILRDSRELGYVSPNILLAKADGYSYRLTGRLFSGTHYPHKIFYSWNARDVPIFASPCGQISYQNS